MKTIFLPALALFILLGCASSKPITSGIGVKEMKVGQDFHEYVTEDNPDLAEQLHINQIQSRVVNDFLEVNVELLSNFDKTLNLQYQFNWFDDQGFVIAPDKSPWIPLVIHGFQDIKLRSAAPTNKVASFSFYVRIVPEQAYNF